MQPLLYTDVELVEMIKDNNRSGFTYVFNRYAPLLIRVISKQGICLKGINAIIEDVFCDVWNNIHQYSAENVPLYMWIHQQALCKIGEYLENIPELFISADYARPIIAEMQ